MMRPFIAVYRTGLVVVAVVIGTVAMAFALMSQRPAEAQGVMSAPACQCSAPTTIPGLSTTVVHCLCGGMACVLGAPSSSGAAATQMQCVK